MLPDKHPIEIANLAEVEEAISYCAKHKRRLGLNLVRQLHKKLMDGVPECPKQPIKPGELRSYTDKMEAANVKYLTNQMSPAFTVRADLVDLLDAIESGKLGDDNLVVAARFHYRFVQIHPFCDGNGRMARALSTLILARETPNILGFEKPINEVLREHREDYVGTLEYCDEIYNDLMGEGISEENKLNLCSVPFLIFYGRVVITAYVEELNKTRAELEQVGSNAANQIDPPERVPDLDFAAVRAACPWDEDEKKKALETLGE